MSRHRNRRKPIDISDEEEVELLKKLQELERQQELKDLKDVCASESGRRFLWRVLEKCKTFESIWEGSAKIHYNSGKQDVGHFLMAEITEADEMILFTMMKESKERAEVNN